MTQAKQITVSEHDKGLGQKNVGLSCLMSLLSLLIKKNFNQCQLRESRRTIYLSEGERLNVARRHTVWSKRCLADSKLRSCAPVSQRAGVKQTAAVREEEKKLHASAKSKSGISSSSFGPHWTPRRPEGNTKQIAASSNIDFTLGETFWGQWDAGRAA